MKKKWLPVLLLALLLLLGVAPAAAEETAEQESEWTVMFYMCGSDLESKYHYATESLKEIASCVYPHSRIGDMMKEYKELAERVNMLSTGSVNVLIETGGCKQWHAQELGMEISNAELQRWRYNGYLNGDQPLGFALEQTLPLQSMAEPETLSDFVRWASANYPAKKYALVLWDHGGGSKTGIFIDELFGGDMMHLDELGEALRAGGVQLEAVLFDACLMAGVETASAIADSASWMIASEEVVAGKGSAVNDWLQQLYISPELGGEWLGRWVCDMSQIRYADQGDEEAQQLLTWSVIDLSRIPQLVEKVDFGFESIGKVYARYPKLMSQFAKYLMDIEKFGTNDNVEGMYDLSGLLYAPEVAMVIRAEILQDMLETMKETVVYCVRGPGRSAARGLSFCYAVDFDLEEMESYARNCPMPHYLAFLDAISPWTAPNWVYETCERLPEMSELDPYRIVIEKVRREDGTPALAFHGDYGIGAGTVRYRLFRKEESTGRLTWLGVMPTYFDASMGDSGIFTAVEPWLWPALEGQPVTSYVNSMVEPGSINYLASIPILIGTEKWFLRYGYFGAEDRYTVYGLWEGYDTDSSQFNRNVKSLSQLAGQEYSVIYPYFTSEYEQPTDFVVAPPQTIYRAMNLEDRLLPPGTYYMQYIVYDMFMRPMPLNPIEAQWNGEEMIVPEDSSWTGTEELQIPEEYW